MSYRQYYQIQFRLKRFTAQWTDWGINVYYSWEDVMEVFDRIRKAPFYFERDWRIIEEIHKVRVEVIDGKYKEKPE